MDVARHDRDAAGRPRRYHGRMLLARNIPVARALSCALLAALLLAAGGAGASPPRSFPSAPT